MERTNTAYFIADAHLGIQLNGYDNREKDLISFLHEIRDSASYLFIVGDLFDFWIEYKHAIRPEYFSILHEFKLLRDSGISIYYLAGNHDFALGPFLEHEIGMKTFSNHLDISVQGKNIHLVHGDGIIKSDVGYRFWRTMLRNPLNQKIYKLLHPNIGVPIASTLSKWSRSFALKKCSEEIRRKYMKEAIKYLDKGSDIIIMGHTHYPELYNINTKFYCNVGEWIRKYSYAKLENGVLSLWQYFTDKPHVEIKSQSLKEGKRES